MNLKLLRSLGHQATENRIKEVLEPECVVLNTIR